MRLLELVGALEQLRLPHLTEATGIEPPARWFRWRVGVRLHAVQFEVDGDVMLGGWLSVPDGPGPARKWVMTNLRHERVLDDVCPCPATRGR
jgi:hypothetical protein